jgi:hypothetical protein
MKAPAGILDKRMLRGGAAEGSLRNVSHWNASSLLARACCTLTATSLTCQREVEAGLDTFAC